MAGGWGVGVGGGENGPGRKAKGQVRVFPRVNLLPVGGVGVV